MTYQSAEDVKQTHIEKMGAPLGATFSALWQALATAHFYWKEYVELFGTKPERLDLLNRAAPGFFRMIEDELWEMSLLHLARLTDSSRSFSKEEKSNLTVRALPGLIEDAKLKQSVQALVDEAVRATEFARDWRNRLIAHRDLKIALEEATTPLAEASRAQVNAALKALENVLNAVETHYYDSSTAYDFVSQLGGAVNLLYVLDDGLEAQAKREERIESGNYVEEDIRRREL